MINRPNYPPIENGYALRREILPKADAELDCIQKSVQVAHSASRKVMEHHDGPGLWTALRERAIHPSVRFRIQNGKITQQIGLDDGVKVLTQSVLSRPPHQRSRSPLSACTSIPRKRPPRNLRAGFRYFLLLPYQPLDPKDRKFGRG